MTTKAIKQVCWLIKNNKIDEDKWRNLVGNLLVDGTEDAIKNNRRIR